MSTPEHLREPLSHIVFLEQLGPSFENMAVVLDQAFRARVCLTNLALSAIATEEPVIAQRSCVALFRDPDALSPLLLEALEAARTHGHVRALSKWPIAPPLSRPLANM